MPFPAGTFSGSSPFSISGLSKFSTSFSTETVKAKLFGFAGVLDRIGTGEREAGEGETGGKVVKGGDVVEGEGEDEGESEEVKDEDVVKSVIRGRVVVVTVEVVLVAGLVIKGGGFGEVWDSCGNCGGGGDSHGRGCCHDRRGRGFEQTAGFLLFLTRPDRFHGPERFRALCRTKLFKRFFMTFCQIQIGKFFSR